MDDGNWISKEKLKNLTDQAIGLCKGYDAVSTAYFQRKLMIDFDDAELVMNKLREINLLSGCTVDMSKDGEGNTICKVNKEKLRQLNLN